MAIGDKIGSMMTSLGGLFGHSSGAPTSTGVPPSAPISSMGFVSPSSSISASPSAATTAGMANFGATMDPTTQALIAMIQGQKMNPWIAAAQGLGPLGQELLRQQSQFDLGTMPHPAQPQTGQPGPFQFQGSPPPGSPLATAALIEQLL